MLDLRFQIERGQLRYLAAYVAAIAVLGVVLTSVWWATRIGQLGGLAVGIDIAAVLGLYSWVAYRWAFSEFSSSGIRTRGLAGPQSASWPEVRDIDYHPFGQTATVLVTCTDGTRFRLGAPVHGGSMPDEDFYAKLRQIQQYRAWAASREQSTSIEPVPTQPAAPATNLAGLRIPPPGTRDRPRRRTEVNLAGLRIPPDTSGSRRTFLEWYLAGMCWVVVPALAAFALISAVPNLPADLQAARGDGVPGVLVVTGIRCSPDTSSRPPSCAVRGTFRSDDRKVVLTDIPMVGPPPAVELGQTLPARKVPASDSGVYPRSDSYTLVGLEALFITLALLLLLWWLLNLRAWWRGGPTLWARIRDKVGLP